MSEKICPACGAKIESTSNICAYCGHNIKVGEKSLNSSSPVEIFYSEATKYLQNHPRDVRGFYFYIKQVAVNYGISNVDDLTKLIDIIVANVRIEDVPLYGAGYKSLIRTYDAERLARARVIADQQAIEAHKAQVELTIQNLTADYAKINTSKLTKEDKAHFDKKVEAKKKSLKNSYPGDDIDYKDFLKTIEKEIKGTKTADQIKKEKAVKFIIAGSAVAAVGAFIAIGHIPVVEYSVNGGYATCRGVKGLIFESHFDIEEVEVASEYQGKQVTTISDGAFSEENKIRKISLPSTITEIEPYAFAYMYSLEELNLDETNVKNIGDRAFNGDNQITSIVLPNTVETIGESAFSSTGINQINLPNSVIKIGSTAFTNTDITSIYLPENIQQIGENIIYDNYDSDASIYYPGSYQEFKYVDGYYYYIDDYNSMMKYESVKIYNTDTESYVYANVNSLPTLSYVVKPGYEFKGYYDYIDKWYDSVSLGNPITDSDGKITSSLFEELRTYGKEISAYPYYEPIEYSITYEYNGADTYYSSSSTYTVESDSFYFPSNPSKTGYYFDGWYLESDFSGAKYTSYYYINKENPSNLKFYAKWTPNTYTVSTSMSNSAFSNRGTLSVHYNPNYEGASKVTRNFSSSTSYYYDYIPTRTGYAFVGWYYDTEFTKPFNLSDVYLTFNKETNVYARWVEIPEDCDYVLSNCTSSYNDYSIPSGEASVNVLIDVPGNVTLKLSNSYRSDIRVLDSEGNELFYETNTNLSGREIKLTGVELGDVITIETKTDSYDYLSIKYSTDADYKKLSSSNSQYFYFGSSTVSTSQDVAYDSYYTLKYAEIPGYTFKGYYTSENGYGTKVTDSNGKSLEPYSDTSSTTLYAYYTSGATYSITYDSIDDYEYSGSKVNSYSYGSATILPTLTKYGYTFLGWCEDKEMKTTPKTSLTSTDFGNKVLYPKFKPGQYKVSYSVSDSYLTNATKKIVFDLNYEGGSTSYYTKTVKNGDYFSYPSNPSRSGYYFAGWYSDKECLVPFDIDTVQSGPVDQKVYAKWIDNSSNYALTSHYTSYSSIYVNSSTANSKTFIATSENPTFYYYNSYSGSNYAVEFTIYNETQGTTITTKTNTSTSTSNYITLSGVNNGDVITISYRSAGYYSNYFYYKFSGSTSYSSSYVYFTSTVKGTSVVGYEQDYELSYVELPGREFKGYYTQSNGTGIRLTDETGKSISGYNYSTDLTVYPYYVEADPYKITYEGMEDSETTLEDEYTYGVGLDLENPTRTGYDFDGWYLEDSYSTKVTSISTTDFGDKTLYAKWTPKKYKVGYSVGDSSSGTMRIYFDENYSGGSVYSRDITSGSTVSLPSVTSRSYYVFLGWYLDSACTTPFTGDYSALTHGDTLYAKWSNYSTTYYNPTSNYTSTNYVYVSSYSTSSKYFVLNQTNAKLYLSTDYTTSSYRVYYSVYNYTKGTTLSSGYLYGSYTVSLSNCNLGDHIRISYYKYNYNNYLNYYFSGTSVTSYSNVNTTLSDANFIASTEVEYDSDFTIDPITKSGYTFVGYYTGPNGTGIKITDNTGASVSKYAYTSDLTVYPYFI